jgi:hypothetical protein
MIATDKFLIQLGAREGKDFQPDPKLKKLSVSDFLTSLFCYCDDFMDNYENDPFSDAMQNGFLNFQKALNKE